MEENNESFRDEIVKIAEIADKIETSNIFKNSEVIVDVVLNEDDYRLLQSNFRDIDKKHNNFSIVFDSVKFKFSLRN